MSKRRYKVQEVGLPHFLTCSIVGWVPIFTRPDAVQIVLDTWRFLQERDRLTLFGYVVMENHLHLIASAGDLSKEIGKFKSWSARRIIGLLAERREHGVLQQLAYCKERHKADREHQMWQEGSHPQAIQGEAMMRQKLEYIHNNPVRRGYVDAPEHWRYSSARDYAGHPGLLPVCLDW